MAERDPNTEAREADARLCDLLNQIDARVYLDAGAAKSWVLTVVSDRLASLEQAERALEQWEAKFWKDSGFRWP